MSEPTTHTMRAQVELRRKILNGELPGGARLFEVAVAEALNISRTPARAAMARLAEEGLLERGPRGGFVVRSFDLEDAVDTILLRGVLEGAAARLAAERGVPEARMAAFRGALADLESCFGEGPEDLDFDGYSRGNTAFHASLARLAGSATLAREIDRITRLPFASPSAFLPFQGPPAEVRATLLQAQEQHRRIVAAIEGREGYRAEALAREHAQEARINLTRFFDSGRPPAGIPALALVAQEGAAEPPA